jgi:hypothetical protein
MRQQITAIVKTTIAVDEHEVRKQLEKLCVTVESVRIGGVK